jgi:hypothetical protein
MNPKTMGTSPFTNFLIKEPYLLTPLPPHYNSGFYNDPFRLTHGNVANSVLGAEGCSCKKLQAIEIPS